MVGTRWGLDLVTHREAQSENVDVRSYIFMQMCA